MKRDDKLDFLRGIAILIVILGHVIQFSITGYENTLLFNIIWSLQIPLFMVISGYFSVDTKQRTIFQKILLKMRYYLVPFITCFIINNLAIKNYDWLDSIVTLVDHLENSLWYLFVLFILSVMNDISYEISKRLKFATVIHYLFFAVAVALWLIVWKFQGGSFLGSKYIVFYSVFFVIGRIWRQFAMKGTGLSTKLKDWSFALASSLYCVIILSINLYFTNDTIIGVIPRLVASILGVFIVITVVYRTYRPSWINNHILWCGKHSLELYFVHYLLCRYIPITGSLLQLEGLVAVVVYFVYLVLVSVSIIKIVSCSPALKRILWGK